MSMWELYLEARCLQHLLVSWKHPDRCPHWAARPLPTEHELCPQLRERKEARAWLCRTPVSVVGRDPCALGVPRRIGETELRGTWSWGLCVDLLRIPAGKGRS